MGRRSSIIHQKTAARDERMETQSFESHSKTVISDGFRPPVDLFASELNQ
jgi:hypothetical protein